MRDPEAAAPADAEPYSARPSIGDALRATREFRRISLEHASELLRIEPQFLIALEEERFAAIGPPVFVKGYLKHYCELLGLDPRPLLDELRERLDRDEPALQARRSAEYEQKRSQLGIYVAGGIAAVAAVVLVWQLAGLAFDGTPAEPATAADVPADGTADRDRDGGAGLLSSSRSVVPPSAGAAPNEPASAAGIGSRVEPLELPRPSPLGAAGGSELAEAPSATASRDSRGPLAGADRAADGPGRDVPTQSPAPPVSTSSSAAPPASAASSAVPPASAASAASSGAPPASAAVSASSAGAAATTLSAREDAPLGAAAPLQIELRFVEDSWTEVSSASGERLLYGLYRAGAAERVGTGNAVTVLLGNADGVDVRVNGEPFTYPAGSRRGATARFRLSPPEE